MRNVHYFLLILILIFSSVFLRAEKVFEISEIDRPESILIGNGYVYFPQDTTIFIYDIKSFKFIGKFGKAGEGPGEIKKNPFGGPMPVVPYKDKVYISSLGKLSIFSKDGKFEEEFKISPFDSYYPFYDRFVVISTFSEDKGKLVLALYLADKDLKKSSKPIYITDFEVGENFHFSFPTTPFYPIPYLDKLYIIDGLGGFSIKIYNLNGEQINNIKREYNPIKVSADYEKKTVKWFKTDARYKNVWNFMRERISYKKLYPAIYDLNVDENKMYIFTNKIQGEDRECFVTDLLGKNLKTIYLPHPELYGMEFTAPTTIFGGYFYILKENIDEESWELHKIKL